MLPPQRPSPRDLLLLYRSVLRLHRARLPPPMRALGDRYVRDEFRAHRDATPAPTDAQWAEFAAQWRAYRDMLSGTADLPGGRSMRSDALDGMTPEQEARLALLEREARTLGSELLGKKDEGGAGRGGADQ